MGTKLINPYHGPVELEGSGETRSRRSADVDIRTTPSRNYSWRRRARLISENTSKIVDLTLYIWAYTVRGSTLALTPR